MCGSDVQSSSVDVFIRRDASVTARHVIRGFSTLCHLLPPCQSASQSFLNRGKWSTRQPAKLERSELSSLSPLLSHFSLTSVLITHSTAGACRVRLISLTSIIFISFTWCNITDSVSSTLAQFHPFVWWMSRCVFFSFTVVNNLILGLHNIEMELLTSADIIFYEIIWCPNLEPAAAVTNVWRMNKRHFPVVIHLKKWSNSVKRSGSPEADNIQSSTNESLYTTFSRMNGQRYLMVAKTGRSCMD